MVEQEHGPAVLRDQLADLLGVERIEVIDAADVQRQHGPQGDGVAERMKERQDADAARRSDSSRTTVSIASTFEPMLP